MKKMMTILSIASLMASVALTTSCGTEVDEEKTPETTSTQEVTDDNTDAGTTGGTETVEDPVDSSDPCDALDCGVNGECIVSDGEATCDCEYGYEFQDGACVDTRECMGARGCLSLSDNQNGCEMSNCTYNPGQCIGAGNNPDCPPLATEELCDANDSCTWWSATCEGAATLCSEFEDQLSCDQVECIWF